MRTLIYIPTHHEGTTIVEELLAKDSPTRIEMPQEHREFYQRLMGEELKVSDRFFGRVRKFLSGFDIDRVYDEGVINVTQTSRGLRNLENPSEHHKLVSDLLEGGAKLIRTESSDALEMHINFTNIHLGYHLGLNGKRLVKTKRKVLNRMRTKKFSIREIFEWYYDSMSKDNQSFRSDTSVREMLDDYPKATMEEMFYQFPDIRDRVIAGRIDKTLQKGETGVLFLGASHQLDSRLKRDYRDINLVVYSRRHLPRGDSSIERVLSERF